jgi:hypothetical protein
MTRAPLPGSRLLVLLTLSLGGCSNASSANAAWVGDWSGAGSVTTKCGGKSSAATLSGDVVVSTGSDGSAFQTSFDGCDLAWTVSATNSNAATLNAGQTCSEGDAGVSLRFSQGSGTLDVDTMTLTESAPGAGGCSIAEQLTLTRVTQSEKMK